MNEYCECCVTATMLKLYTKNFIQYIYDET